MSTDVAGAPAPILSIPTHLWVECLSFLRAEDMHAAGTRLCRSLAGADVPAEAAARFRVLGVLRATRGTVRRWPSERWTRLYALAMASVGELVRVLAAYAPDHVDEAAGLAASVIFGVAGVHLQCLEGSPVILACVEWKSCRLDLVAPARIIRMASELADLGLWRPASDLLRTHGRDPGASKPYPGCMIRQRGEEDADAFTMICKFLIDRLYSATYVNESVDDALDLSRAVAAGRAAVHNAPFPATVAPGEFLRAAYASLELGRATSLMGQFVGLGVLTRPCRDAEPTHAPPEGNRWSAQAKAESYFREGLEHLENSLRRMGGGDNMEEPWKMEEAFAATLAARGELLYCASSVLDRLHQPLDIFPKGGQWGAVTAGNLTRASLSDLAGSFCRLQTKIDACGPSTDIQRACADPVIPRGALVLQARTAKDLAKVMAFASRMGNVPGDQLSVFFDYSLVVYLELFGPHHPLTKNVKRLINEYVGIRSEDLNMAGIAAGVNQWLREGRSGDRMRSALMNSLSPSVPAFDGTYP